MTSVGGDDGIFFGEGVFDASGDGFLAGGEMAETSDFLFLVESIGGHFHSSVSINLGLEYARSKCRSYLMATMS